MTAQLALPISLTPVPAHNGRPFVWCWGRCGGWGFREADTGELPCTEPLCLREAGHEAPRNPRVK